MPRTIRVTGKGVMKLKPDTTRITMILEGWFPEYENTLSRSKEDTEELKNILEKLDFEKSDVKTLSFNVEPRYESYEDTDRSWKQRLTGYQFRHVLKAEFESDNERLGRILYALANAEKIRPEFRLSYTVKDVEGSKNALLAKAVEDAAAKAKVLAKAAGVELSKILKIDYSWGEIEFESRPMARNMLMEKCSGAGDYGSYDMDIEPDDIEVSDTVTVEWEI